MLITELSIRRPVVSWVMSLILIVFGLFVFWKLPVRELPSGLQPPVVQVQVDYASASAPIIDQEVTQVLEDVIGGAEGIKNIDSKSSNGRSTIKVEFDTSIDLDNAANDIRERVARVVDNLPSESDPPQILKQAAGFTTTMWLALSSSTWSDLELGDYAERYLVDTFSSVKNVGRILVGGLRELSIRVWVDPIKLAANDLTVQEVERALRGENIRLPAGTLEANNIDLTLNLDKSYNSIETIKQLPIKKTNKKVVVLSDVANIEFGPVSEKTLFKAQRKDQLNLKTVGIGIYARSGASTVELSKEIKKKTTKIENANKKVNDTVTVKVISSDIKGLLVKPEGSELEFLIKKSQIAINSVDARPSRFVGGERIDAAIADLNLEKRKITLSIKLLEELMNAKAIKEHSSPLSGKNLPFSSLSERLDDKKKKKESE